MYHNINAGRLRQYVEIQELSTDTDDYGQPLGYETVLDARAEVQVKSGKQMQDYGTSITNTVITVLMWYNDSVSNNQALLFNDVRYTIQHVKPDELFKSMILTCEVMKK